ncbi:MAG: ACT domain-containing protein [Rickettsiella sp.]|nr:ACT domain-containing protein [Rickettsiella sp.]
MENLVVVILGFSKSPVIGEVFNLVAQSGCHVMDARVNTTATHVTMTLLIGGAWNTVAKFESSIKKFEGQVLVARTQFRSPQPDIFPYSSYIVAPDTSDVLAKLIQFLLKHELTLYNIHVEAYKAPITEAAMLGISLSFGFHENYLVADFREHFIIFCDDNNFDVAMEPQKN